MSTDPAPAKLKHRVVRKALLSTWVPSQDVPTSLHQSISLQCAPTGLASVPLPDKPAFPTHMHMQPSWTIVAARYWTLACLGMRLEAKAPSIFVAKLP